MHAARHDAPAGAHCRRSRPAAARWPEGPVCDTCYTAALRRHGTCVRCGRDRRLVAPPGSAATTCVDCSDTGPAGHVCKDCGREDKLYERGRCAQCSLWRRADALLCNRDGTAPVALAPVRDAILASTNPRTALNWLRHGVGAPILIALARGELPLTHAALDAQPARRAADYLRALLVAHGALPERDDALTRLERAVAELLADINDVEDRRTVTAYATWRVLQRVRRRADQRLPARTATRHARTCLRAAVGLLDWLHSKDIVLAEMRQADLDRWLATGPPTLRHEGCDFLTWAAARQLAPRLNSTRPVSRAGQATDEDQRRAQIHRLLHQPDIATIDRAAGCFMLLYGQQPSRIVTMTRDQVHDHATAPSVRFGHTDVDLTVPLIGFVRAQLATPHRHHSIGAPNESPWLFPGHLPGRPITAGQIGQRLGRLGINAQTGRRAALLQLAIEVPAAVLAGLLGMATTTASDTPPAVNRPGVSGGSSS